MAKEQKKQMPNQPEEMIFALDIGTRSIIGMLGTVKEDKIKVIAVEKEDHTERAMVDGQIENIEKVAYLAGKVKKRLEDTVHCRLSRVCVAAAGRALRTQRAEYELELPGTQLIDDEVISQLEAGAINRAEEIFDAENTAGDDDKRYYLVGYTVCQYYLDQYMMSSLKEHRGKKVKADLIATFLPSEVVESLYTTMHKIMLDVVSITLEPIAAINAAIPENLRLLNLVMVDIGAGTSDIAVCTGGSVTGYTMATVAGDEITEMIMKKYLVDFQTAEKIKSQIDCQKEIIFTDILGFEQTISQEEALQSIEDASALLCREIAEKIVEVNGSAPSALFLAGGGSKLAGLREGLTSALKMDANRIAIAGNNFQNSAYSDDYDLNNPEYATPLGIVISSGLNLINDSFRVTLNGKSANLFRSGSFTALNLLMMNGYNFHDILGRSGSSLIITLNGERKVFHGTAAQPAVLLINQSEGKLSQVIHAGDCIDFTPAVSGKPAEIYLGDIEGTSDCLAVTLNGETAPLDTLLKNGDIVAIISPETDELEFDEPDTLFVTDEEFDWETASFIEEFPELDNETTFLEQTEAAVEDAAHQPVETFIESTESEPAAKDMSKPPEQASSPGIKRTILFYLNDSIISLPAKESGEPYYLMDMIEYSGIDLKQPKGRIKLTVNGMMGMFQQELSEGDRIYIIEETI